MSALSQAWQIDEWEPRFRGVEQARFGTLKPRRMRGVALRIDLREPGIEFLSTPSNGDRPQETDGLKTSTFLEEYRCQAAINAAPFWPIWGQEKKGVDIKGLSISRGELVSPPSSYPALLITKDNRATIAGPPFDLDEVYTAVCGFSVALEDGEPVRGSGNTHPRVGAGVSKDGRYLYLVVIDGRQYHHSIGATRHELGQWLRRLGAWNGLNLDGGGTATMCVAGARGQAIVVNRPIHQGRPGNERVSGSHLGVKARPLE